MYMIRMYNLYVYIYMHYPYMIYIKFIVGIVETTPGSRLFVVVVHVSSASEGLFRFSPFKGASNLRCPKLNLLNTCFFQVRLEFAGVQDVFFQPFLMCHAPLKPLNFRSAMIIEPEMVQNIMVQNTIHHGVKSIQKTETCQKDTNKHLTRNYITNLSERYVFRLFQKSTDRVAENAQPEPSVSCGFRAGRGSEFLPPEKISNKELFCPLASPKHQAQLSSSKLFFLDKKKYLKKKKIQ